VTWDAIVVGAGPAGAATGILLTAGGRRVLVLDRARFPRPKICGEYLSPQTARILDRLGVLKAVESAGAVVLAGMAITAPDGTRLVGTYPTTLRWRGYRDHALALPRLVLDRLLVDRLRETSADVREGWHVRDLVVEGDRVAGVEALDGQGRSHRLRAPIVVGADGRNSVVARRLGLVSSHPLRRLALVTDASSEGEPTALGEIFVDPPVYSIANPVAPGHLNLSLVVPLGWGRQHRGRLAELFDQRIATLRPLGSRFAGLRRQGPVLALGPLAYRAAPPRHAGVVLVGDAGGFYDPFTGEGIYTALTSAEAAATAILRALDTGDVSARALGVTDPARRRDTRDKQRFTEVLQALIARRSLANVAAHLFARRPALLDLVMGVIGDFVPARALIGRPAIAALLAGGGRPRPVGWKRSPG
jgi:flavin-dependent dehydrogenase